MERQISKIRAASRVMARGDFLFLLKQVRKNIYATWDMELFELREEHINRLEPPTNMTIRPANTQDADAIVRIWPDMFIPYGSKKLDAYYIVNMHLRDSLRCFVMEDGRRIVSVLFIKDASKWINGTAIEFAKCATDEEYRGHGLIGYLLHYSAQEINPDCRMLCRILKSNYASIRAFRKAGFDHLGVLRAYLIFGVTNYRIINNTKP